MIIDANDLILGRIATVSAKKALTGEKIDIVNCEHAVIIGDKRSTLERFKEKRKRGTPAKGPFYPKRADLIIRRTIRGMLPYKQAKGREAFKKIKCHIGIPNEFKDKKIEVIKEADLSKVASVKYIKLGELCEEIGRNPEK